MKNFNKQSNRGFTMIEMLIAVFIFTLSLAALMTISARGLRAANQAQKQVTADYLALESIEGIRNMRDSALLTGDGVNTWEDLFDNNDCWSDQDQGLVSGCAIVYGPAPSSEMLLYPCSGNGCSIFYNEGSYVYRQFEGGVPSGTYRDTGFDREIQFSQIPGNIRELVVTVIVTWGNNDRVEYTENLFLWL